MAKKILFNATTCVFYFFYYILNKFEFKAKKTHTELSKIKNSFEKKQSDVKKQNRIFFLDLQSIYGNFLYFMEENLCLHYQSNKKNNSFFLSFNKSYI